LRRTTTVQHRHLVGFGRRCDEVYRCARALRTRHRGRARTDVTTVAGKYRLKNDYFGLPDDDPLLLPLAPLLSEPAAPLSGLAGAA
jgi:hypothetical protein